MLHQLAVTGHAWADVAVLIGGQDFRIYRIHCDDDKIANLIQREAKFWQCVTDDQQPDPDGSDDAGLALQWLFPRDDGQTVDLSESVEYNAFFSELLHVRQSKEETDRQESQLKQRLQVALGSATAAVFQQGRISWRKAKDRWMPGLDKLTLEYPELLQQYGKPVLGSRRFLIQPQRSAS